MILLKGGTGADILIKDGRIDAIGYGLSTEGVQEVIDLKAMTVVPGFVDLHVHFREPGYSYKETIRTGSLAAAHGGFTTVCAMPNLNPVPDSPENIDIEQKIIDRDALIDVLPYASITLGRKGLDLVNFAALKERCVAFSDDGSGVQNDSLMKRAMQLAAAQGCIIAAHCEDNSLLKGGYIHDGRYCATFGHKGICSQSEWGQIERDLEICEETGCHYHVCHISCKESVELIRQAKARGVKVTCETAPHYLVLCEDDMHEDGRYKMNPPLRSVQDRDALVEGLKDGTIDVIATDHAPHCAEEKAKGLKDSAMGIVGLETAFPILYTYLVKTGKISFERLIEAMSTTARRIFRIGGGIVEGSPADLTVVSLDEKYKIDSSDFLSMGHSSPFEDMEVYGRVKMTFKDGKTVWKI